MEEPVVHQGALQRDNKVVEDNLHKEAVQPEADNNPAVVVDRDKVADKASACPQVGWDKAVDPQQQVRQGHKHKVHHRPEVHLHMDWRLEE